MGKTKDKITPVKFNAFFEKFEEVVILETTVQTPEGPRKIPNNNVTIFTDVELVEETNDRLEPGQRITLRTFEGWKKNFLEGNLSEEVEGRFFRVYKRAIRKSKEALFNAMVMDPQGWTRFAWIMERKFSETWGKEKDQNSAEGVQPINIIKTYNKELKK